MRKHHKRMFFSWTKINLPNFHGKIDSPSLSLYDTCRKDPHYSSSYILFISVYCRSITVPVCPLLLIANRQRSQFVIAFATTSTRYGRCWRGVSTTNNYVNKICWIGIYMRAQKIDISFVSLQLKRKKNKMNKKCFSCSHVLDIHLIL